jgi:hypothetical protein
MTSRRTMNGSRRVATLAAAGVLAAAATVVGVVGVAHAASSTTCAGTSAISYSPGLTLTPRTVRYTETDTFSGCVSTDTSVLSGVSITPSITVAAASCLNLPGVFEDPAYTISWNNGQHSVVDLTFTDVIAGRTEQGTGPVISGEFQDGNATLVWLYPVLNPLQCLTSQGVTSQSGPVTAQITAL